MFIECPQVGGFSGPPSFFSDVIYVDGPLVRPTAADLELLLSTNDVEPPKQLEEMHEETETTRRFAELRTGSIILVFETRDEGR